MKNATGGVVIVTGGAQGIGRGIASWLMEHGARVVIADIDAEAGRECLAELGHPGQVHFIETDVSKESSVMACIEGTLSRFHTLTALINNAGISGPGRRKIEETPLESWQRVIQTNLTGCFLMVKHAAVHLRKTKGSIVNIASTRAVQSEAHTEAYAASKGGIVALTHALSISLGPDIRVNCISPGWIEVGEWKKKALRHTPALRDIDHAQHPAGRVGTPFDIAAMAAYLISEDAGFITGQNFIIDGGMTRKMIYAQDDS